MPLVRRNEPSEVPSSLPLAAGSPTHDQADEHERELDPEVRARLRRRRRSGTTKTP